MSSRASLCSCVAWALFPLAVATAQQESRGAFPGIPAALSVDALGFQAPLDAGALYLKPNGFLQAQPGTSTQFASPAIDLGVILRTCGASVLPDVNALSIGQDWVLSDDTGHIEVPPDQWAGITFSVSRGTLGMPGSVIRAEADHADGAAGTLFSYILPGSALPPELVGITQRAQDSREINLGPGPGVKNIDAIDHFIPIYDLDPLVRNMLPASPRIFFSLSSASALTVPASWWAGTGASGATILEVSFGAAGGWNCPSPYLTFRDLGFAQTEDIDALAIDLDNQRMLLSTTSVFRNQILFVNLANDFHENFPYQTGEGEDVAGALGFLAGDDVDAICAMDPPARRKVSGPNPFFFLAGTPRPRILPFPGGLSASAFRGYDGVDATLDTWAVGWPPNTGQGDGLIGLFWTTGDSVAPLKQIGPLQNRNPANPFAGDPVHVHVKIPANIAGSGMAITLRWFTVDIGLTEIAEAQPIRMIL